MKAMIKELSGPEMMAVTGGKTNNNPNPGSMTSPIDQIVNGKNYDAIAQMIADWLNGDNTRSRKVKNDVDIYDTDI